MPSSLRPCESEPTVAVAPSPSLISCDGTGRVCHAPRGSVPPRWLLSLSLPLPLPLPLLLLVPLDAGCSERLVDSPPLAALAAPLLPMPSIMPSTADVVRFSADRCGFDGDAVTMAVRLAWWALVITSNGVMGGAVQRAIDAAAAAADEGSRGMERARVRCIEVGDKTADGAKMAEALCGEGKEEEGKGNDSDGKGNEVNKSDDSVG